MLNIVRLDRETCTCGLRFRRYTRQASVLQAKLPNDKVPCRYAAGESAGE